MLVRTSQDCDNHEDISGADDKVAKSVVWVTVNAGTEMKEVR